MRALSGTSKDGKHTWALCTYCEDDGLVRCGGLPPLECPICFGSKHDYRSEERRAKDSA
jgi:hypothetical protein